MSTSLLGHDPAGNPIYLDQAYRREQTYVIGGTGTGKSVLFENLILQDIDQGLGVCVLEPSGDLINRVIERMSTRLSDVILLDVTDGDLAFGLNLYQCPDPTNFKAVHYTIERIMRVWDRLFNISRLTPQMVQYMRKCAEVLIANPGYTMAEIPLLFYDKSFRYKLLANVHDANVKLFWQNYETMPKIDRSRETSAIMNKLDEFLQPMVRHIVGQEKSTINMREIMDNRKILLVKLDGQVKGTTSLIGSIIVAMILMAAYSRENILPNKRKQFNVYVDEGDYFATEDFKQVYDECRKYGVACTFCHQTRVHLLKEVPELARSILQAKNHIVFHVTDPDAQEMSGSFSTTPPPPKKEEAGRRKKQVPVTDVVGHLLRNGHKDATINAFRHGSLALIGSGNQAVPEIALFNCVLYNAMVKQTNDTDDILEVLRQMCTSHQLDVLASMLRGKKDSFAPFWKTGTPTVLYQEVQDTLEAYIMNQIGQELDWICYLVYDVQVSKGYTNNNYIDLTTLLDDYRKLGLSSHVQVSTVNPFFPAPTWYSINFNLIEWELHTQKNVDPISGNQYDSFQWKIKPNQEWKFYNPADLHTVSMQMLKKETKQFELLVNQLKHVMKALQVTPILGDSGEEEIVYRPLPQMTSTEKRAQIQNELTLLPNMQARAHILGQAYPSCSKHGFMNNSTAKFCRSCGEWLLPIGENILHVARSTYGIPRLALQQRIDAIKKQNLADGYVRKRTDIDAEINQRQQVVTAQTLQPTPPMQVSPPKPLQQSKPSPAIAVALPASRKRGAKGKTCPSCQSVNSPGAIYCSTCGKRL